MIPLEAAEIGREQSVGCSALEFLLNAQEGTKLLHLVGGLGNTGSDNTGSKRLGFRLKK